MDTVVTPGALIDDPYLPEMSFREIGQLESGSIGARLYAIPAPDTVFLVNQDNPILSHISSSNRTNGYAWGFITLVT